VFIKVIRSSRDGRRYQHAELVESYRDAKGRPRHRVLARFGAVTDLELANYRAAVEANQVGHALVMERAFASKPYKNLEYLSIAVLLAIWKEQGLDGLLRSALSPRQRKVSDEAIVAALVLHRCTAPDSKLAATVWYPKTALPEIQTLAPEEFNNTRVHRALEALEEAEGRLRDRLAQRVVESHGPCTAVYLDVTDTWFVGRGPPMAKKSRTKEGFYKEKIAILLVCDRRGLPLYWRTVAGDVHEVHAMQQLVEEVSGCDWCRGMPFVADRALGRAGSVEQLAGSGLQFITALPVDEIESYTPSLPWAPIRSVPVEGTEESLDRDIAALSAAAEAAGFCRIRKDRFTCDLGAMSKESRPGQVVISRAVAATTFAIAVEELLRKGKNSTDASRELGVSRTLVQKHLRLQPLVPAIRQRILAGDADSISIGELEAVARLDPALQERAFDELAASRAGRAPLRPHPNAPALPKVEPAQFEVRLVANFNPYRFLEQRRTWRKAQDDLLAFVADLNARIVKPSSRRSADSIRGELSRELKKAKALDLYNIALEGTEAADHSLRRVQLVPRPDAVELRRRYEGFTVHVASPTLALTPAAVVEEYYKKDMIEKDFQTIKSELDLRPFRHRTDMKVLAHVTLCILALLVVRALELKTSRSAGSTLEILGSCYLNLYKAPAGPVYTLTAPDERQTRLLSTLGMEYLAADEHVRQTLSPRAV
jgi:hypothetical protein